MPAARPRRGRPTLQGPGHPAASPDVPRPITFDADVAEGRNDLVYVHLGHPIVQKAQRLLRSALWSVDSPLNRVTAVVVDDLAESFVAAVTRMVLVGRGGIRLHEEVFLAGVRLHGRRAMAEEKAEAALDEALDGDRPGARRRARCATSSATCGTCRTRRCAPGCEESMQHARRSPPRAGHRAARPAPGTPTPSGPMRSSPRSARNLRDSLDQLQRAEEEAGGQLFADDQQRQRRRDIDAMRRPPRRARRRGSARDRRDHRALRRREAAHDGRGGRVRPDPRRRRRVGRADGRATAAPAPPPAPPSCTGRGWSWSTPTARSSPSRR